MSCLARQCLQNVHLMKGKINLIIAEAKIVLKKCKKLKKCPMKIINYEKKEMIPLTKEEKKSYKNKKHVIYVKKSFVMIKMMKTILIEKRLKITVITQENLEELLIVNAT